MGSVQSLSVKLGADEAHAYTGIMDYPATTPTLGRIYVILVRKGNLAWKIALSLMTIYVPGTREAILDGDDHAKAGAMLGTLALQGPDSQHR